MGKIKLQTIKKSQFLIVIVLIILNVTTGCKQNVSQWRGPDRDGIYNETNILNEWPEDGPDLLWVYEGIGKGYGAPSVLNDIVFVNGEQDSLSFLFAFDLEGNLLWKSPNGKEFTGTGLSATYPGARSTPTVYNNLVYSTSGMGRIACFETSTGNEVWAVDIVKDLGGRESEFGYAESVAIDKNNVYCFPGGVEKNMAALDRFNGKTVWSSEALRDTFSYCSPIFVDLPNRKILITHSRHNLYAVDCSNGEALGSYKLEGYEWDGEHCNTPVYDDSFIYFVGNDEKGKGAVKLELDQNGENITEVWYNKKIRNNFGGFVKVENNLFTTIKGNWLKALDVENGTVTDSVKVATGSLIYADSKFICYGMNGDVNLINYKQNKFDVTGTFKIKQGTGHHFSHPVIANGIMYVRHGNALLAYKIKK
ncbi:MAG: PQQ-binding-like beta-propeller repeat protein [Prolixibacteraceae bacterium]|jgi:outer membrane protein assembly factor BamB|nr:PQQ-binding-like beta-propeller repeat protein [Prolixibacteraceae bacterium]MBT6006327.1 PQQ-binding-like beta-propeller repeat protein [Prolixibacteraceae bacterium]MBT6765263.1 PQQ-binding-like beta-propeller repeat protein [Prolixibacteraceae bacterium]MBT6999291.1 PQQ-binding-like beta-propeller repeat protein [Prolixibacteraceae bacterium]MBT7396384.1 PQQ-binding-like beta-propeller repeat protein [Prolixibacteraceae bacterium]